jgi:A118 family predicted phage portal protein
MCILPLTVRDGRIIESVFISEVTERGDKYIYVEIHTLENGTYVIENRYYKSNENVLTKIDLPDGIAERFDTGSPYPFFAFIMPNIVNVHDNNLGLGCAVFAEAVDNLMGVDIAYNNFNRDLWLGGKKVFYNRELTKVEIDEDGKQRTIPPDDMLQQLFVSVGDEFVDDKKLIQEFNPSLRVQDNKEAVQAQLDYLSFKCGMGVRHYQFDNNMRTSKITATQYIGEKQELKQNASKHAIIVENALREIIRAILWTGSNLKGESINPDAEVKVEFSDGYVISDEEKRAQDAQDVRDGLMQPWEYRVNWYNETEEEAKRILGESSGMTFGGLSYPPGEDESMLRGPGNSCQKMYASSSVIKNYKRGDFTRSTALRLMELAGWDVKEAEKILDDIIT